MKESLLNALRFFVLQAPRSKLLNFLCRSYIEKYQNYNNTNIERNGEYRWLNEVIRQRHSPVVFDVGANIGDWTKAVLDINPSAQVHAFEPFEETYDRLVSGTAQHHNVSTNNMGLGSEPSTQQFYSYHDASEHNSLHPLPDKEPDAIASISIDTIANYCQTRQVNYIDYLKIDTEGHDVSVLRGAEELFQSKSIYSAQFEYNVNYIEARAFLKDVFDLIAPYDYQIYKLMPHHLQLMKSYHFHHENFMYSNYVILVNDADR